MWARWRIRWRNTRGSDGTLLRRRRLTPLNYPWKNAPFCHPSSTNVDDDFLGAMVWARVNLARSVVLGRLPNGAEIWSAVGEFMREAVEKLFWPCTSEIYLTPLRTCYSRRCGCYCFSKRAGVLGFLEIIDFTCWDDGKKSFNHRLWTYCRVFVLLVYYHHGLAWRYSGYPCCEPQRYNKFDKLSMAMA